MKKEEKQAIAKKRREQLRELSQNLKLSNLDLIANGVSINGLLVEFYRQQYQVTDLNTYEQWKNKGFQVKKGSQSYMVWATPRDIKVKDKRLTDNTETEKEIKDYFAVCHLFDVSQVVPIQTEQN